MDYVHAIAIGAIVGVLYSALRIKAPAPPIVALAGLLGIVLGEHLGNLIRTRIHTRAIG